MTLPGENSSMEPARAIPDINPEPVSAGRKNLMWKERQLRRQFRAVFRGRFPVSEPGLLLFLRKMGALARRQAGIPVFGRKPEGMGLFSRIAGKKGGKNGGKEEKFFKIYSLHLGERENGPTAFRISELYPVFAAEALSFSGNWKVWEKYPGAYRRKGEWRIKTKGLRCYFRDKCRILYKDCWSYKYVQIFRKRRGYTR